MGHLKEPPNKSHQYSCSTRSSSDPPTSDVGQPPMHFRCKVEVMSSAIPAELLLFLSCLRPLLLQIANEVRVLTCLSCPELSLRGVLPHSLPLVQCVCVSFSECNGSSICIKLV